MTDCDALVSIIVPVYGAEAYLPACIESLCKQSYPHIQIILVDDRSPDSCPEICDRYAEKDPRITVIHQENKGVSGARNTGLDHAAGDFFMFVDSDDELFPGAVELLVRDANQYNADVVSAGQSIVTEEGKVIRTEDDGSCTVLRENESLLCSLAGDVSTVSACAKLFRTAFMDGIRFVEGKNINEDGFFVFQCCAKKPVFVRHTVAVYRYNVRQGSNSKQRFSDKYLSMLYFCDRKKEITAAHFPQYQKQVNNMEARTNLEFLQVLCSSADKKYKPIQKQCIQRVRRLRADHIPTNSHYKKLAWIVSYGLYPLYKIAIRLKYYR